MPSDYLLIGDIGGTNGRFALHSIGKNNKEALYTNTFLNSKYITNEKFCFTEVLKPFLAECFDKLSELKQNGNDVSFVACFAVAGPVKQNTAFLSNIRNDAFTALTIDGKDMEKMQEGYFKHIKHITLINDFQGQGYGLLDLDLKNEAIELIAGSKEKMDPNGPRACVGAGTGLGQCYLTPGDDGFTCYPSEGGHVDFAPRSEIEFEMLLYLRKKFGELTRISVERIVSGKGLANVYDFLSHKFPDRIDKAVHKEFLEAEDMQGKTVAVNAKPGSLCEQAMQIFSGAYGAECGSAALKFIPTGGLYVAGGLTPKNIHFIQGKDSYFMKAFHDKGRVSKLLFDEIPLFAVMTESLGLRGALYCAAKEYNRMQKARLKGLGILH